MAISRSTRVTRKPRRGGMTLLEVLAGLVLLGTLASTALIARGRAVAQWGQSARRIEAARAADRLLTEWWLAQDIPLDEQGRYDDPVSQRSWYWQTRTLKPPENSPWLLKLVRLRVMPVGGDEVLATIDLAWPYGNTPATP